MTPRTKSLIVFTAATALFAGTQNFAPAQSKSGGSAPSGNHSGGQKGGGGAPARGKAAPSKSAPAPSSANNSSPAGSSSSSSSNPNSSSSSSSSANNSNNDANADRAQNQNRPQTPAAVDTRLPIPADTRRPIPGNPTPSPRRVDTTVPPGAYPPSNARNPAPGQYVDRRRLNERIAQQPIVIFPTAPVTAWPWWYDHYFPTYGFFGDGVDNYSGFDDRNANGGWYDDNYTDRHPRNPAPATPAPAPTSVTPAAPNAAASLESDPAYQQAVAEVARQQAAYDEASRKVLDQLKKDSPEYRQLLDERAQANQRVEQAQEAVPAAARVPQAGPDPAKVAPAAQRKLDLNTKITQMEQEAIRKDAQASAARKALEDATAQLTALRRAAGVTR